MFHAIEHLMESGVRFVTVWGFSTDNWKRQEDEISSLFKLVDIWIRKNADWAQAHKIKLRYIGRLQELPDNLQEVIQKAVTSRKIMIGWFSIWLSITPAERKSLTL